MKFFPLLLRSQIKSMESLMLQYVQQDNNPQRKSKIKVAIQHFCQLGNKIISAFNNFDHLKNNQISQINCWIVLYEKYGKVIAEKTNWKQTYKNLQSPLTFKWENHIQNQIYITYLLQQELQFCKYNLGIFHLMNSSKGLHPSTQNQSMDSLRSSKLAIHYLTNTLTYLQHHQVNIINKSLFLIKILQSIARGIYYRNLCKMLNFKFQIKKYKILFIKSSMLSSYDQLCKAFSVKTTLKIKEKQITDLIGFIYINRALSQAQAYQKLTINQMQYVIEYLKTGKIRLQANLNSQVGQKYLHLKQYEQEHIQLKKTLCWFDQQLSLYQKRYESYGTRKSLTQQKISIFDIKIPQKLVLTENIPNLIRPDDEQNEEYVASQQKLKGFYLINQKRQKHSFIQKNQLRNSSRRQELSIITSNEFIQESSCSECKII